MLNERDYLEIPVSGKISDLKLIVNPENSKEKVFEKDNPRSGESKYQLEEGHRYVYEFVDSKHRGNYQFESQNEIVRFHPNRTYHANMGTLVTGIYVGSLSLNVCDVSSGEKVGRVCLEIRSSKADYEEDYQLMLKEIAVYYTDLVLQQGSLVTQKVEIDYNCSSQTLYQRFSFVRSLIESDTFSEAIHKIISNPVRKWTDANIERNIVGVKRLNRKNIRQISSSTDRILLPMGMRAGLPENLTSVPRRIEVEYKRDTTDCQENQFVKFVLRTFVNFCSDIRELPNATERLKEEASVTLERLYEHLDNQFFRQISLPSHMNMNSPVLQRKEGYREVLQNWLLFDLAAKLNWDGGENVYDAGKKNVATLYEYWLFFKLMELISEFFHVERKSKNELVQLDKDGINLSLKQGRMMMIYGKQRTFSRILNIAFYYNRTFNKQPENNDPIHKAGSWTMTMRPDYTLSLWPGEIDEKEAERQELIVHIHFDAKYRLNKVILEDKDVEKNIDEDLAEEKEEQELKIYKRGDLLKMHAYKDAIRRTSGAYVLYPGTDKRDPLRGFHEIVPGLGAFSIRPGHWQQDSIYLKQFLAEVKAHLMDRTSDREKLSFYQYDVHLEPNKSMTIESLPEAEGENRDFLPDETTVLIGYYKNQEHLDWIMKNWLYNGRAGDRGGAIAVSKEIVTARYILLHNGREAILHKINLGGPKVFGYKEMKDREYPFNPNEKNEDKIYLVFRLNKKGIEKELQKYEWHPDDIKKLKLTRYGKFDVIGLTELMKIARIKS